MSEMKLSQAIREGARIRPQAFGDFYTYHEDGECHSCALGAAGEAVGLSQANTGMENLERIFPVIGEVALWSFDTEEPTLNTLGSFIGDNLNDGRGLTREQIADWLEEKGF